MGKPGRIVRPGDAVEYITPDESPRVAIVALVETPGDPLTRLGLAIFTQGPDDPVWGLIAGTVPPVIYRFPVPHVTAGASDVGNWQQVPG